MNNTATATEFTAQDFTSDQEIRWCPGCGDYAIVKGVRKALAEIGTPPEKVAFVSGIGCAARFPYYMSTYGFHTIHGRAPTFATGLKLANPELDVWVVGGDGDMLSIGGNHTFHVMRRNVDVNATSSQGMNAFWVTVNMGLGLLFRGTTPLIHPSRLQEIGVSMVSYPRLMSTGAVRGMMNAMDALDVMIKGDQPVERPDLLVPFKELNKLVGIDYLDELEDRYSSS